MTGPRNFEKKVRPHITIDAFRESNGYEVPLRNIQRKARRNDYAAHAAHLLSQLELALRTSPSSGKVANVKVDGLQPGRIVEVFSAPLPPRSRSLATKIPLTLEFSAQDVVILRTKRNDDRTESALLFIPNAAHNYLTTRITNYGRDPGEQRRPDLERFEVIEDIRAAEAISLFITEEDLTDSTVIWWELWVRQPAVSADQIVSAARVSGFDVHGERLYFPDTTVVFVHAALVPLVEFASKLLGAITEIRRATGTIAPFLDRGEGGLNQHDWIAELAGRVESPPVGAPAVCILDTGVAQAHPLISPGLRGAWAYDERWGADDHCPNGGHGTPLTGLVLYGDLEPLMSDARKVSLTHAAESMKLLPPHGFPATRPHSYGVVTQGAVASVEARSPNVLRSFCLATSTTDFPSGRPSTWSGAIDQIASGAMLGDVEGETRASNRAKRLVVVATGNVSGGMALDVLPLQSLEDPSQSWNALTIGGFTRKEEGPPPPPVLMPAVPANHRSPFSRGSQDLPSDLTPIKPEVLFEAGNMSADDTGFCAWEPSMSLLSTGSDMQHEPIVPFWATSAAVGLAGNFVGRLQAAQPNLWPETHRALIVDSARWPVPIWKKFVGTGAHWKTGNKAIKQQYLREFGYGVPDIQRAIFSALNDATLIAQTEIQPFAIGAGGREAVFNELHFYDLPWPKRTLEQLENEVITMKVTLSYFVEPNITGKAATRPDTYRSFGLRFAMKKRGETNARFRSRITANQESDSGDTTDEASHWLLGPKAIQAGSLHCDLWRGYAIDLAGHDAIAVYPVGGWWKSHVGQKRISDKARYSLVISICAEGHDVDLYSEITSLVNAKEIEILLG